MINPKIIINPTTFNPQENEASAVPIHLLSAIFNSPLRFIAASEWPFVINNIEFTIQFTHHLLKRPRKDNPETCRIEILDPSPFASGFTANLHQSLGVLLPEQGYRFKAKANNKQRVCKKITLNKHMNEQLVYQEYFFTQLNKKLRCKKPILEQKNAYLIMKKIPGEELFEIIKKMFNNELEIPITERFQLSLAILKAFKEQVRDIQVVHRDIKPENILVDLEQMNVTIIDYAFAIPETQANTTVTLHGTPDYFSPETILHQHFSPQTDLFALGLTLAQLWGDLSTTNIKPNTPLQTIFSIHLNRKWIGLFENMLIPTEIEADITNALNKMVEPLPQKRIGLQEAMNEWSKITKKYSKHQELPLSEITQTHSTPSVVSFSLFNNRINKTNLDTDKKSKFRATI